MWFLILLLLILAQNVQSEISEDENELPSLNDLQSLSEKASEFVIKDKQSQNGFKKATKGKDSLKFHSLPK